MQTQAEGVVGHIDYLKFTIFFPDLDAVALEVRDVWLQEFCDANDFGLDWIDLGPAKRIASRRVLGVSGISLLDYRDLDCVGLELKGEACALAGDVALRQLMRYMLREPRNRVVRLDYAFDNAPFTVFDVKVAIDEGNYVSRCRAIDRSEFMQNDEGHTVYFPRRRGGGERMIRVYDRRGPVRLELELVKDSAELCGKKLKDVEVEDWPAFMMSQVRGLVDFVDVSSATRKWNAKLLPWWEQFVGSSPRAAKGDARERRASNAWNRLHQAVLRCRRAFVAGLDAFDEDPGYFVAWFTRQCEKDFPRDTDEHREFVRSLRSWRGGSLGQESGWKEEADDVPF